MTDPRIPDPRVTDPNAPRPPYSDPAADPRLTEYPVTPGTGRGGLIAAGVIAVLLVVALIAFTAGPGTDPDATATIPPGQIEETVPAPAPGVVPMEPAAPAEQPADQ